MAGKAKNNSKTPDVDTGFRRVKSIMGHLEEVANVLLDIIPLESGIFLKKHGPEWVTSLRIGKTNILPDVLSGFSSAILGQNIVHTYFIINGVYLLERYNIVNARELTYAERMAQFFAKGKEKGLFEKIINVENQEYFNENKITIHQLITNYASFLQSTNNAWQHYNSVDSNCQHFCLTVLEANCIPVTEKIEQFTFQNEVCQRIKKSLFKKAAANAVSAGIRGYAIADKAKQCFLNWLSPEEASEVVHKVVHDVDYDPAKNVAVLKRLHND